MYIIVLLYLLALNDVVFRVNFIVTVAVNGSFVGRFSIDLNSTVHSCDFITYIGNNWPSGQWCTIPPYRWTEFRMTTKSSSVRKT